MKHEQNTFDRMDTFRARQVDLNAAPHETVEIPPVEQVQTKDLPDNSATETTKNQDEQKIDLWMKSIKDFIRSIDTKSL
ncbi:MAG: hypothetical protein AB9866_02795 [Syntrophobacteraceae bacterium]